MLLVHITAFVTLLGHSTATSNPHAITQPKPWQIWSLTTFFPSGRPESSPWNIINATITDPNEYSTIAPATPSVSSSTTICAAKWMYNTLPYNQIHSCDNTDGADTSRWTFEMFPVGDPSSASQTVIFDFIIEFKRTIGGTATASARNNKREEVEGKTTSLVGSARFTFAPGNATSNLSGACGASGVCSFGLREERTPFLVEQTRDN